MRGNRKITWKRIHDNGSKGDQKPWKKMEKTQESVNKHLEDLKNKHTETNNKITEIKNSQEGINNRISEAEEWNSELEDKIVEITSEEQSKVKRIKRTKDHLRHLWDNIKCTSIQIIGVPGEEEKKKEYEKKFEEIIVEKFNFPNMENKIVNQAQEMQRVPYRINPERNMPGHILIKLTKTKHKERILKAAREKQQVNTRETPYT